MRSTLVHVSEPAIHLVEAVRDAAETSESSKGGEREEMRRPEGNVGRSRLYTGSPGHWQRHIWQKRSTCDNSSLIMAEIMNIWNCEEASNCPVNNN